jgi:hypothetical protein
MTMSSERYANGTHISEVQMDLRNSIAATERFLESTKISDDFGDFMIHALRLFHVLRVMLDIEEAKLPPEQRVPPEQRALH